MAGKHTGTCIRLVYSEVEKYCERREATGTIHTLSTTERTAEPNTMTMHPVTRNTRLSSGAGHCMHFAPPPLRLYPNLHVAQSRHRRFSPSLPQLLAYPNPWLHPSSLPTKAKSSPSSLTNLPGLAAPRHATGFRHWANAQGGEAAFVLPSPFEVAPRQAGGDVELLATSSRHQPYMPRTPLQPMLPTHEAPWGHGAQRWSVLFGDESLRYCKV